MALAAIPPTLQLKTYDDLQTMPDDGNRYELINGEICMSPAPRLRHQDALMALYDQFRAYLRVQPVGKLMIAPFDVKFSEADVVQPDLFVALGDWETVLTEDYMIGAPDLVVEVLSPSNRRQDLVQKAALYQSNGVPEYWVVDPDAKAIAVNVLTNGRYAARPAEGGTLRSAVLPGLVVVLADVFPEGGQG